ncbi:permease prefix domain 1-containing protein [Saccharothrix sp. Mg75]|uniref:permease prefix domain 1-containing protein n=1 Tax=Saccharothrix sp. Mg75 TaxID=3445357 RepID=UPI003EEAFD46
MARASLIDDYVTALDRRLRGPAALKDDLVAEARDSLADAADAHRSRGLPDHDAEHRAVTEFGPVATVARDYQSVLGLAHGARTLRTVVLVLPTAHVLWELNRRFWIGAWGAFPAPPPDWYLLVARANDSASWVVAGAALLALLTGRALARRGVAATTLARLAGAVAAVAVTTAAGGNVAIVLATAHLDASRLLTSPPVLAASLVSLLVLARLAVLARRSVVFSSV